MSAFNAPTAHNGACPGEIAETVLMPGDPARAKWIAKNYLREAARVESATPWPCGT